MNWRSVRLRVMTRSTLVKRSMIGATLIVLVFSESCSRDAGRPNAPTVADGNLGRNAEQWLMSGGDWTGSYYSSLSEIDASNVARLGLAWEYDLASERGQESTPVVVDGILYASTNWGRVVAVNAATGVEKWTFNPEVDGLTGRNACCDVVNRGLSVHAGKVYVGAFDGRLIALDAKTGQPIWQADTIIDHRKMYSITGAPQIAGNVVVIGNAGGDFATRGYVTAYDLSTGKQAWRFFTVPGDPKKEFEHPELAVASKSWDPNGDWKSGGGGTVWDGMAYDPSLNLLYVGTGNAAPYDREKRSPSGGDNLYLASILAINPDNGRLKWHYQEVPKENWDYTATAKMILADLNIAGKIRKVLMQAPKNGFFYVLDRETGQLISAKNYTYVNWASHVETKTGRPVETGLGDWQNGPKMIFPSPAGGHSWYPMSFSPKTGLVYIPVLENPMIVVDLAKTGKSIKNVDGQYSAGFIVAQGYRPEDYEPFFGKLPKLEEFEGRPKGSKLNRAVLRAWDPVAQKVVWEREVSNGLFPEGGVMATAGNLVFQGRSSGELWVYAADSGKELARIDTGTGLMAAPMTYELNGEQYVSVIAGMGGGAMYWPWPSGSAPYKYRNKARIITFKLGGGVVPKPPRVNDEPFPMPPPQLSGVSPSLLAEGGNLYAVHCGRCHVMGRGLLPDLRRLTPEKHAVFNDIVLKGLFAANGMGRFDDILDDRKAKALHAYLINEQTTAYNSQASKP